MKINKDYSAYMRQMEMIWTPWHPPENEGTHCIKSVLVKSRATSMDALFN